MIFKERNVINSLCTCWLSLTGPPVELHLIDIPGGPKKWNSRYSRVFRTLLWSKVIFFTLLDRESFPHYNNTKIIKFGWELFILWVISYGPLFSGFARFPEFRGTINDSFSSTCTNTYQHSTSYREISVPMTCLDCKYLLGNTRITEHNTRSIYGRPKLSLIVPRNSGNHKIKSSQPNLMIFVFNIIMRKRCSIQQGKKR